jgi:hypothetical protein
MEISTSSTPARKPFFLDEPRLNVNPSHSPELAATIKRCNDVGVLMDPTKAILFKFMPPEVQVKIWKDAFTEWSKTQPRVRIVIPASSLVSDRVICDTLDNIPNVHPNSLSDGSGFASEICPLLNSSFEAREMVMEAFAGSLDVCTCYQYQCYQCQNLDVHMVPGAQVCYCKKWCDDRCRGKSYFTRDQIFYLPGFATISQKIGRILSEGIVGLFHDIHPLAWASKLQNVALEAHHLAGQPGDFIKDTLSKFTSLRKLYIVWRFDPIDYVSQSFITRYASEDNDNKKIITPGAQLDCLRQTFFESPVLWLNRLPGVETEFIFVPVDLSGGDALSEKKVNRSVLTLEDYFTPGNHARKIAERSESSLMKSIYSGAGKKSEIKSCRKRGNL